MQILDCFYEEHWYWISSTILVHEINQTSNLGQRNQIKRWLARAHQTVFIGESEISRADQLKALGFKEYDALHLACAESSDANVFLTTDDALLRRAKANTSRVDIKVENPHAWLSTVQGGSRE